MGLFLFPPPKVATFNLLLVLTVSPVSFTFVNGGIPTTLEGPFKPVTVPLDDSFRGNAVDLPDTDPRVRRIVKGFEPEQISVSLSTTHDSVWISWITGEFQIGDNIKPLDPNNVSSIVTYGRYGFPMDNQSTGYSLIYNQLYPFEGLQNYTSGIIHHVRLTGLRPNTLYQYQCGDPSIADMSKVSYFKTMPVSGPKSYPRRIAVVGDLGLTHNTTSTVDHLLANGPDLMLLVGDVSYANLYLTNGTVSDCYSCSFSQTFIQETYQPRWDYWGRFMQPLVSKVPMMVVEGNHEIEEQAGNQTFASYSSRFAFPSNESGSSSTLFYSFNAGGIHFIMLGAYTAYHKSDDQYKWLEKDLAKVDRNVTPWLVAAWHPPWYSTYKAHYREEECMKVEMEDILYKYGVDIVFNGHVHAYERSNRVYNYTLDPCGPVYITVGDGGNREKMAIAHADEPGNCPEPSTTPDKFMGGFCAFNFTKGPAAGKFCWDKQPEYSAYRESSFGHGILEVKNETYALWTWHRNQDMYSTSADVIYIVRQPDRCPVTDNVATFNLLLVLTVSPVSFTFVNGGIPTTLEGPFKPVTVPLDDSFRGNAVDLPDTDPRVRRIVEGFEPEQISVSLSTTHDSVWISWITGEFQIGDNIKPLDPNNVSSIVTYGRYGFPMDSQSTGYSLIYNQLYPFEGLQNYTSGIIHHVRLTGLRPNSLYQYQCGDPSIADMSKVSYFKTMPVSGPKSYPRRIAVVGDLGLTYNTTSTVDHLLANGPDLMLLVGDVSYANLYLTNGTGSDCYSCSFSQTPIHETYQPRWDYWGRFMQPLVSKVPMMVVEGNHEIEEQAGNQTFASYSSRFAFPSNESGSSSTLFYSFNAGGIHFIMLGAYTAYHKSDDQYKWLEKDLAKVDRNVTPWLVAAWHPPWYSTYKAHYREEECMKVEMEDILYKYGVDIVFNGHVHAYERSNRVYNYTLDPCGPVYITVGDGGNREKMAIAHADEPGNCPEPSTTPDKFMGGFCAFNFTKGPAAGKFCWDKQPEYSAYRESSFGHGILEVKNETYALWTWHRNQDMYSTSADVIYIVRQPDRCPVTDSGA